MITQHKNDSDLCPVRSYATLTQRILHYKGTSLNTPINTFSDDTSTRLIHSNEVFAHIKNIVRVFGKSNLGFDETEVGTHSIRSSAVMQLFLNKIPTFQIMLLGRWSSDAFLKYIRRQVQEFSSGLSTAMVNKEFFTVPEVEDIDDNDPRTRNTASFASTPASGNSVRGARFPHPAVHTWM